MGPRDGLQNDKVTLEPAVRAELCTRLAADRHHRASRRRASCTRSSSRRWPARRRSSRAPDRRRHRLRQPRPEPQGPRPRAADVHHRDPRRLPGDGHVRQAQPEHDRRGGREHGRGDHRGHRPEASRRRSASRSAARSRARSTRALVIEHAHRMAAAGADEVILADTIGVGVPRQVDDLVPRGAARRGQARRRCTCTTRATRATRTRTRPRARRDDLRRLRRRPRRLPVRARARPATSPPRT